jgi:hypothetical protein
MMLPVETSRPVLDVETDPTLDVNGVTISLTRPSPSALPLPPTNVHLTTRTSSEIKLDVALNVNSSMDAPEEENVTAKITVNVILNTGLLIAHA